MDRSRFYNLEYNSNPFEIIEDDNDNFVVMALGSNIFFGIGHGKETDFSVFASDIIAWNRKTNIECRRV